MKEIKDLLTKDVHNRNEILNELITLKEHILNSSIILTTYTWSFKGLFSEKDIKNMRTSLFKFKIHEFSKDTRSKINSGFYMSQFESDENRYSLPRIIYIDWKKCIVEISFIGDSLIPCEVDIKNPENRNIPFIALIMLLNRTKSIPYDTLDGLYEKYKNTDDLHVIIHKLSFNESSEDAFNQYMTRINDIDDSKVKIKTSSRGNVSYEKDLNKRIACALMQNSFVYGKDEDNTNKVENMVKDIIIEQGKLYVFYNQKSLKSTAYELLLRSCSDYITHIKNEDIVTPGGFGTALDEFIVKLLEIMFRLDAGYMEGKDIIRHNLNILTRKYNELEGTTILENEIMSFVYNSNITYVYEKDDSELTEHIDDVVNEIISKVNVILSNNNDKHIN